MPRVWLRWLLIIAVAGIVTGAIFFVDATDISSRQKIADSHPEQQTGDARHKQDWTAQIAAASDWLDRHREWLNVISTIFIAVFTGTLWRATTRLWQTSQDQVHYAERAITSAEKSAERQSLDLNRSIAVTERQVAVAERHLSTYEESVKRVQRGYLSVTGIESTFAPHLIPGGTVAGLPSPSIRVVVRNHGRTPINIITSAILTEPHAAPPDIPKPVGLATTTTYPAEMIFVIIGRNRKHKFPDIGSVRFSDGNVRDELRSGALSLYCYGRITYRDIFMDQHETVFCRRYDALRHEFVPDGGEERNYNT